MKKATAFGMKVSRSLVERPHRSLTILKETKNASRRVNSGIDMILRSGVTATLKTMLMIRNSRKASDGHAVVGLGMLKVAR